MTPTHVVLNQVPPLVDYDVTAADPALATAVPLTDDLRDLGVLAGSGEIIEAARLANVHSPVLRAFDRFGHRIDEVEFHPAWHHLMSHAVGAGLAGAPWASKDANAHRRRAAGFYIWTQAEAGHLCPISMTYAAVAALPASPALMSTFGAGLTSRVYQPGLTDPATKSGLLAGMSMTEKQGGSDVRAGTTRAVPDAAGDDRYRLTGHKWFTSAPMNDLFLTLAQAPGGLTCFVVPRVLPGGERNTFALQRLKDKLGNRSNASAEIEYDEAVGLRIGDEGASVRTILRMVTMTRLDCVLGSAGGLRAALSQAAHHAGHRTAFGRKLVDQPAMTAVLADLAVESWAATSIGLRLAAAVDAGEDSFLRLALPVSKFWVCKQTVPAVAEALECMGGNGYVEESVMPRLFRESPLNGIWEGSGNVAALDAVRACTRGSGPAEALRAELSTVIGVDRHFDAGVHRLQELLRAPDDSSARAVASLAARLLGASLLLRSAPSGVAGLYCATRLGGAGARAYGELPGGFDLAGIVAAVTPRTD